MSGDAHLAGHEVAAAMLSARSGPLADVRVVDLTQALAGPYCTMILADMGADVIKVEPPRGDLPRFSGPFLDDDEERHYGGYFASINRNKRGIVLDLKDPEAVEQLLRLLASADVLVENFKAGVMERLGLSWEMLHERFPSLVYAAIRGFGDPRTGESPHAEWPSFDVVAQAMGGLVSCTGIDAEHRVAAGPSIGDLYPATMCAVGILGALHHVQRTGEGQFVDVAMTDSIMALCESVTWRYSYSGEIQAPRGTEHPSLSPFNIYPTADGLCAIASLTPGQWEFMCGVLGRPDLVTDDRTRTTRRRADNREMVNEVMESWSRSLTTDEIVEKLAGEVPVGPVNDAPALFASEHVRARDMLVAVEHPGSERPVVLPNTPMRFSATPTGIYRRPPKLGEHQDEVLDGSGWMSGGSGDR
ncbi:MAG: CoA transferase [Acidimicrobiaceae bacterium]|nr:CoA transferase [Acidimicrobiaceae bacterium]